MTPHPADPEPAGALRAPGGAKLAIAVFTAAGFALTLQALYPGYPTNDATFVYGFIKEWRFGDWQSPVMSLLWWLIDPIAPGTGSMFLLVATLYWLGFAVAAVAVARRSARIGNAAPPLRPGPPPLLM